ncbi:MAG: hypothetical protein KAR42_13700 [candidate division Zixibacteria bacterium]|nr:hypothetical protein [candidate division Zixibacteria bacterium]
MKNNATVSPSDKLTCEFVREYTKIACDFLRVGLIEFHRDRFSDWQHYQVPLANLCIGIELLVKAYLAKQNLSLIFTNLPQPMKAFIICPDSAPKNFSWDRLSIILRTDHFNTLNLNEAFSLLFNFSPSIKQQIGAHTKILSKFRNAAIHNICTEFDLHTVDRAAYVGIELMQSFIASHDLEIHSYIVTEKDRSFLKKYSKDRTECVRKKLNKAVEKAKNAPTDNGGVDPQGWAEHEGVCPVCKSDVLLHGETVFDTQWVVGGGDEDASLDPFLTFFAEEMECESCHLKLEDPGEFSLAGVDTSYDKSDSLDQWLHEKYGDYY